jgi:hypothetical protein
MKIMLDCSPAKIAEYRERYGDVIWHLRTPLTRYARAPGIPYGLDNGCFAGELDRATWDRMLEEAEIDAPVFACLPDVVGDARRTVELFKYFTRHTNGIPRALVLQNGIEDVDIPWDDTAAVFIGGDDAFKISPVAIRIAKVAKMLGKWVHVGRVNTAKRVRNWRGLADSIDGTGMSRYDHMLEDALAEIQGRHPQHSITEFDRTSGAAGW